MEDFYGRQSEGPSDAELLAYYDPADEVISPVRPAKPVAGTKSPAPSTGAASQPQMRFAPETETPGRRRGPGGSVNAKPSASGAEASDSAALEGTLRPGEVRQPPWLGGDLGHHGREDDERRHATAGGHQAQHHASSVAPPAVARASAQYVNPEDLPAGLHQRQQFTSANVTQTTVEAPPARRQPVTPRSHHTDATAGPAPIEARRSPVAGGSRSASQRSAEDVGSGGGYGSLLAPAPIHHRHHSQQADHQRSAGHSHPVSARASHDSAPWHQAPATHHEQMHRDYDVDDDKDDVSAQEEAASARLAQELERERQRTNALEAKLEEAAARADAASAAAIDMQAQLRHASRSVGAVRSPSKDSPVKPSPPPESSVKEAVEAAAEIARLKAQVSDLEATLERERDEHRQNVKRLVESTSDDVAKAISRAREAEAATEQLRARVGAQQTEVEVAQARAATLSRALEEERQDNAALSASFRTRLAAAVSAPPVAPVYAAPQAASTAPRDYTSAQYPAPQQYQQQSAVPPQQSGHPSRSPPRNPVTEGSYQVPYQAPPVAARPQREPEPTPALAPRTAHTPERVSREAPVALRTPPRQTPRVPTTAVPAAGVQSPPQTYAEGPDGANLSPTRAGQTVRDKNATLPSAVDPREVEALEARLFELSKDRDSTDQQLRRIENVRIRSLADKAKKDNLTRRLSELNNSVSDVRKRLRELSALER